MKIRKTIGLLLGLGMACSAANAQYCMTFTESISENFNAMPEGGRPLCWVAYSTSNAAIAVQGVSKTDNRYHMSWPQGTTAANTSAPGFFELIMRRCTMRGVLTFKLARTGNLSVPRPFLVGTKGAPTFVGPFNTIQTIQHNSLTETTYTVDLSNYTGPDQFIAFRVNLSNGNGFTLDDINWTGPPATATQVIIKQ